MAINSQYVTGFAIGIGASALGFYLYKKNQSKVDQFLRDRGIQISSLMQNDPRTMSVKDLIKAKEELEDIIAEKEYEAGQGKKKTSKNKSI
jgi:hypothetical protein